MEEGIINGKVGVIKMSTNSIYTENWLPIKNINNNMIILDNKMLVTGVKIQPRNLLIHLKHFIILLIMNFG